MMDLQGNLPQKKCPIEKCLGFRRHGQITCFNHWRKVPPGMKKKLYMTDNKLGMAKEIIVHVNAIEAAKSVG